jgi:hypothetical protein
MRQAIQNRLNDAIKWHFLVADDEGNEHYVERKIYRCGETVKVLCLLLFKAPLTTEFGQVKASQYPQTINIKARQCHIEQEALIDADGELLHLNKYEEPSIFGCPPNSINEVRLAFVQQLLHDCKRQKLKFPVRRGTHKIRFSKIKRTK